MFAKHIPFIFLILPEGCDCIFDTVNEFNDHCIFTKTSQNDPLIKKIHTHILNNPHPNPNCLDNRILISQANYEFILELDNICDFRNYVNDLMSYGDYELLRIACWLNDIEMYEYLVDNCGYSLLANNSHNNCEYSIEGLIFRTKDVIHNDTLLNIFTNKIALNVVTIYPFVKNFVGLLQSKGKYDVIHSYYLSAETKFCIIRSIIEISLETDDPILISIMDCVDENFVLDVAFLDKIKISTSNFVNLIYKDFFVQNNLSQKIGYDLIFHKRFDLVDILVEMGQEMDHRTVCLNILSVTNSFTGMPPTEKFNLVKSFIAHYKFAWEPLYPDMEFLKSLLSCGSSRQICKLDLIGMGILDSTDADMDLCLNHIASSCRYDLGSFDKIFQSLSPHIQDLESKFLSASSSISINMDSMIAVCTKK
jgi:hypothetical protein